MTIRYHAAKGAPIWDYKDKEIWAFWAEDRYYDAPSVPFLTLKGLLGSDPSTSYRSTVVRYKRNHWIAHGDCIQEDFLHNPLFVMNPLQGPQAMLHGLRALLEDKEFQQFVGDPSERVSDALRAYERRLEQRAKSPW